MFKKLPRIKIKLEKRIILIVIFVFITLTIFAFIDAKKTHSALESASATLSNPRLSYKAGVAVGTSASTLITIDGSENPDNDTNHIFPKDTACFTPSVLVGCRDDKAYTVVGVGTSLSFDVSPSLTTSLNSSDYAISTQSGTLTLTFTLGSDIPSDGDILISIPMADSVDGDDGFPDSSGTSTSTGGFDLGMSGVNKILTSDVSIIESCGGTFSVASVTVGSGTDDHTIQINNSTGACGVGSTLTIGIGSTANGHLLINPAPVTSGRTRGAGEIYTINIKTRNGSDGTLDNSNVLVAPVEAVLISATVAETLSFRVCGVKTDLVTQEATCFSTPANVCGQASLNVASYAYSVPFGTLNSNDTFYNAAQYLKVSTNAATGYGVTVFANDQMGKDGGTCSGAEDESVNCIPDTTCDGTTCTHLAAAVDDWESDANNGLGYSLDSVTGAPATWEYDGTSGTCDGAGTDFCAAHFADDQNSQSPVQILGSGTPVDSDDAFICHRINISGTQPAGYYYNKIKYTATPIF